MTDFAAFQTVPAGATDGTPIGTPPPNCIGVRFYLPHGGTAASVTYAVASQQPTSAPSPTWTVASTTSVDATWEEPLLPGQMIFITVLAGTNAALFRWIMGG